MAKHPKRRKKLMKYFIGSGEVDKTDGSTEWFDWEGTADTLEQADAQIRVLYKDATDIRISQLQEAPIEV
jgi:hypothetical protein